MTAYIDWSDLLASGYNSTQLALLAPGETADAHPLMDAAIAAAQGEMEEYLRRRGVTLPLDTPIPPVFRENLVSLAIDYRTMRFDRRPQAVSDNAERARAFFEKVATGKNSVQDTDPATPGGTLDPRGSWERHEHSILDSSDPSSDISRMFPPIGGSGW